MTVNNRNLRCRFMQSSNKKGRFFFTALLFLTIVFGIFLRVQNRDSLEDQYLFGTDSYRYFRQVRQIVESGNLPRIDTMRNAPSGIDTTTNTTLFPFLLANAFAVTHTFFPNLTLYQFAIFSSIFFISLAALLLYAFTNRLFGRIAALFATLVFVSTGYLISRSFAGYVDTDAPVILFFLASIYLYAEACQAREMWKRLSYTLLSGIVIIFLGLMWTGVGFAITIVVFFNFLKLCTKGYDKSDFVQYIIWLFPILAGLLGLTKIYRSQLFSSHVILAVGVPIGFGILASIFIGSQIRMVPGFRYPLLNKVPFGLGLSALFLSLGCIILALTSRSLDWILTLIDTIFYPLGKNGVIEFVSELQPMTFDRWRDNYGLHLLFAILALCLLTYTRPSRKRSFFLLHCLITGIALLGIAVSRFVPLLALPVSWHIDSLIFAIAVAIIGANILYQLSNTSDSAATDTTNENHILVLCAWFLPSYILACSAERFHVFLAPLIAILSGYTINRLFNKYTPQSENGGHLLVFFGVLLAWQVLICGRDILSFLVSILSFSHVSLRLPEHLQLLITLFVTAIFLGFILQSLLYRKRTRYSVKNACILIVVCLITWLSITGIYRLGLTQTGFMTAITAQPPPDGETRHALNGIKTNTPPNAVIAANWNLGSITNELGRRATIVDEGQNLPKIRAFSQAVFCGENEDKALRFLKEHEATHILIHPMDIFQLNLHFFAATELDATLGRFNPITLLKLTEKSEQELEYIVDSHMPIELNTESQPVTVKKVIIPFFWEHESYAINSPASIIIYDGNSVKTVSVKELIIADRQWYFPEAKISGCVWKRSEIARDLPLEFTDPMAIYITPRARESMTIKLFLDEHSDYFRLVYESPRIYGAVPVKIWEIIYPPDIGTDSMHLHVD